MISIIGTGRVGASIGFLCAANSLDDIVLLNRTKGKAIGECLDIANAIPSNSPITILGTDDYSKIAGSDVVVVTASMGTYTKNRTEIIGTQVKMIREIASKIRSHCPDAVVLIVSNPLDVMTYFFQKESRFLRTKVIGIASSLDSSRLRYVIAEKLNVGQPDISGAIVLGEHGDTMVPVFSHVKISGKNLSSLTDSGDKEIIAKEVREYWKSLRKNKSRSQFGIAKNTFDVINAILHNNKLAIPASVLLEGEFGQNDVCMGVPVVINKHGIAKISEIKLSDHESESLQASAQSIRKHIRSVQT